MAATATVLYEKGVKFDMDYYMKTHMPLVQEKWASYGLTSWKVIQFDDDAPYKVQATLEWTSLEAIGKATSGPEAEVVFGDVPNFSDKKPVFLGGSVMS